MRMTALLVSAACLAVPAPSFAQNAAALSGQVSSAQEGPMEGVVISARKDGATITVSVVSDDKGHFSFPAARLEPGHYAISIRAAGYDLDGPKDATIAAGQDDKVEIKLKVDGSLIRVGFAPALEVAQNLSLCSLIIDIPAFDDFDLR